MDNPIEVSSDEVSITPENYEVWKGFFREQFSLRKQNGIDITEVVIDYIDRYVLPKFESKIKSQKETIDELTKFISAYEVEKRK